MATLEDTLTTKRTPLYHLHQANQPNATGWQHLGGYAIKAGQDETQVEPTTVAPACGLTDLSALARVGLRGKKAATILSEKHYQLPAAPNQALRQEDGSLVAKLSASEYLLLGSFADDGERISRDELAWQAAERAHRLPDAYLLPRQDTHAWLALTGSHASDVMAKLCGVDLSPKAFAPGHVAQTSVARANAIIINASQADLSCLYLLVDSASACYFWPILLDAMQEFEGKELNIMALRHHHPA
ncbi:sarcosine oxidase [Vreelandella maris]|uniref:Sarcosine oxidase n=1 Tax=Vreelandella maris TaxID=2729617 RepID=A0A7Y6REU1_9GAMM|nr:sarcosine oxidase [Halomonas maris]NVF15648.1 sarcosine oxidase [Halomonas maris]|tara:strand:+ start:11775 stop:12506 length:732 start_codon:yes stop_codon:yes gene_type:complete